MTDDIHVLGSFLTVRSEGRRYALKVTPVLKRLEGRSVLYQYLYMPSLVRPSALVKCIIERDLDREYHASVPASILSPS